MKKFGLVLIMVVLILSGCTQVENSIKGLQSDTMGLNRNIYISMEDGTIFLYSGNNIRVDSTEYGNKVIVQINGKRLAVYNASVIVEEKGLEPEKVFAPGELANLK